MRTLTDQEKRTVRIAGIGIAIYLAFFGGLHGYRWLEARRTEYQKMVVEAQNLKAVLQPYENKAMVASKLMEGFHMDPTKLTRRTVMAEASAAIQKSAATGGIQLGPIRETPRAGSSKEVGSMQLEGTGPVPAMMAFLQRFESLGYPLIIDTLQINPEANKPGSLKLNVTIIILDFEQWKGEGVPHA